MLFCVIFVCYFMFDKLQLWWSVHAWYLKQGGSISPCCFSCDQCILFNLIVIIAGVLIFVWSLSYFVYNQSMCVILCDQCWCANICVIICMFYPYVLFYVWSAHVLIYVRSTHVLFYVWSDHVYCMYFYVVMH